MLEDLRSEGINLKEHQLNQIFAPVGLHIGAETPAEIALSILAEIQSVLTKTNAQPLRDKPGTIHDKRHHEFVVTSL